MTVTIEIEYDDLDNDLIKILLFLFNKDINTITLTRNQVQLDEFNKTLDGKQIMQMLKEEGYNENTLKKIEKKLENIDTKIV